MRNFLKMLFSRMVVVALALALQVAALILMLVIFEDYVVFFYAFCLLISLLAVLKIVNDRSNPGYKIAWLIPILLFPIFGGVFYLLFGGNRLGRRTRRKMQKVNEKMKNALPPDPLMLQQLKAENPRAAHQAHYIQNKAFCPPCRHTFTEYLPSGEQKFERLKEELVKAKRYIFLEYFIIQEGIMWDTVLEILKEKVKQGVDVRVIYDDVGSLTTLPYHYERKLEAAGIACCVFNPFVPVLSARLNNRDHRKILVIDGYIGFTGGINLADEYINAYPKHGHWKDSAILLKGDAVWNLTVMFLSLWEYIRGVDEDYDRYRPLPEELAAVRVPDEQGGYVQPFADSPLDNEAVGESVYLNMINQAMDYVYITTPYLILDNEMITALGTAAKSGVDVRIITPHIADKWFVHAVTRANYEALVEDGVRIYEYTPGFIHAKTFASDDELGVVGTINLDYRSLYLHFECGTWLYRTPSVLAVKEDFLKTLEVCREITYEDCRKVSKLRLFGRAVLRVFAPLM